MKNFNIIKSCVTLLVATTLSWSKICKPSLRCNHLSFLTITITSVIAMERWRNEENKTVERIHKYADYFQSIFLLPGTTTSIFLSWGYSQTFSWCWTLLPVLPFLWYAKHAEMDMVVDEQLNDLCLISLTVVSLWEENYYGVGTAIFYELSRFSYKYGDNFNLPHIAYGNYLLCAFTCFAAKALESPST